MGMRNGAHVHTAFVAIVRRRGPGEMMHVARKKPNRLESRRDVDGRRRRQGVIRIRRCTDDASPTRARPTRITRHGNADGSDHLILRDHERHVVRAELSIQLPRRTERIEFPSAAIIHGDFRIPLREVPVPTATTLTAWNSRRARVPLERDDERVVWREGRGKRKSEMGKFSTARAVCAP